MNSLAIAAWAALALCACTDPPRSEPKLDADETRVAERDRPSLYGSWRILEVNGAPARVLGSDPRAQPTVSFTTSGYGGSSGCNSFGGLGLRVGDRWFAAAPMATAVGCGDLTAQEAAIYRLLSGGPVIAWDGGDAAVLRTAKGTLRLARTAPTRQLDPADAPMPLAGTRWELYALDGATIDLPRAGRPARLTFEADRALLETPCATHSSGWRQEQGAVVLAAGTAAARPCPAALAGPSDAIARALTGKLHYVTGPNGELVLASGTHWATGRRDLLFGREDPQLLSGRWRILSVDGTPPPTAERPAELAFGVGGFAVWDGCRHSEGVAIVFDRKLFAHGSGVVSMANCPEDPIRRTINQVVGSRPRIGTLADGGVALVSEAGTLRLRRTSAQPFGTGVDTRLRSGLAFDLLTGAAPGARLTIGEKGRFTIALPCGSIAGRWRNDSWAGGGFTQFIPGGIPPACDNAPIATRLYSFFTGEVHAVIGPNRDIALFVSREDGLPARLASP